jgi:hypothetical protein
MKLGGLPALSGPRLWSRTMARGRAARLVTKLALPATPGMPPPRSSSSPGVNPAGFVDCVSQVFVFRAQCVKGEIHLITFHGTSHSVFR